MIQGMCIWSMYCIEVKGDGSKMRKILLTGVGGDVACAITRCLLDWKADRELYGLDIKKYTPYMHEFQETSIAPAFTDASYQQYIEEYILEKGITHFLPTTEPEILIADKNRDFFDRNNVKLLINNKQILDICTSKCKTSMFLQANGITAPATYHAEDYAEGLEYPFILKSDFGRGSKSLCLINNESDWSQAVKNGMVCQEYVGNPESEFTVGVFSDGHNTNSIIYRRNLGLGGLSVTVECCKNHKIEKIAQKVAEIFCLKGCINIQIREDKDDFYIFEINPRLSSTTGFRHMMGFTDVIWWIEMLDGIYSYKKIIPPYGAIGVKSLEDKIVRGRVVPQEEKM